MLIGQDYDKIQINAFGLELSEPNVFLTDLLMFIVCAFAIYKLKKLRKQQTNLSFWYLFFILYAISSLTGGFGHLFYNYLGVIGKIPSWLTAILSIYIIELAVITDPAVRSHQTKFKNLALIKMIVTFLALFLICIFGPIKEKPGLPFLPIAINTIIGVITSVGILGLIHSKRTNYNYRYFYFGVLVMIPSAIFFLGKINLHPWMDKNDISHLLISAGLLLFLKGVIETTKLELASNR